jgi:hypothetical protein
LDKKTFEIMAIIFIIFFGTINVLSKLWDLNVYREDGLFLETSLIPVSAQVERIDEGIIKGKKSQVVVLGFHIKEKYYEEKKSTFIYIPVESFYEKPKIKDIFYVDALTRRLIIPNSGTKLIGDIAYEIIGGEGSRNASCTLEVRCKLSGIYGNVHDHEKLVKGRYQLWQKWQEHSSEVAHKHPGSHVIFQKVEMKTDRFSHLEYFDLFLKNILPETQGEVPAYF